MNIFGPDREILKLYMESLKSLASLHIYAVSPEPLQLPQTKEGKNKMLRPKIRSLVPLHKIS